MIAYDNLWLDNLNIREQAEEAFRQQHREKIELDDIELKYPAGFYSPNIFIRIGLFILTVIILLFSFGIFSLLFLDSIDHAIGGLAIFFALVSYGALEYMVQEKKHFKSGVDDALLWISAGCLFGGISYLTDAGGLSNCILVFIISLYCTLRFADRVMSAVAAISLLGIFFFTFTKIGPYAKALVPFVVMIASVFIYLGVKKLKSLNTNLLYQECLQVVSVTVLLSFYFSGNYYVVRELSISMFQLTLADNEQIPFGWLFWIFTAAIPLVYLARGIQKKDIVLIRVGLLLVAALVLTVRNYYAIISAEVAMTIGGIVLIVVAYALNRYLKTTRYGFTSKETTLIDGKEKQVLESLLLAQTFAGQQAITDSTRFGGGSFGGGGASSDF